MHALTSIKYLFIDFLLHIYEDILDFVSKNKILNNIVFFIEKFNKYASKITNACTNFY
jgi:hypothetical protein